MGGEGIGKQYWISVRHGAIVRKDSLAQLSGWVDIGLHSTPDNFISSRSVSLLWPNENLTFIVPQSEFRQINLEKQIICRFLK